MTPRNSGATTPMSAVDVAARASQARSFLEAAKSADAIQHAERLVAAMEKMVR